MIDDHFLLFRRNCCFFFFCRKFAPRCCVCHEPIMPAPGQEETVRIVALDRDFHVQCYRCEVCLCALVCYKHDNRHVAHLFFVVCFFLLTCLKERERENPIIAVEY